MKNLQEIIEECKISFSEAKNDYSEDFQTVYEQEKDWLTNLEEKLDLLKDQKVRDEVDNFCSNSWRVF